jgi:hypothetical protein
MTTPLVDRIPFAKIAIVLAVLMMIGLGLCGVGLVVSDGGNRTGLLGFAFQALMILGSASFWLSLLGLIVLLPVWVIMSIVRSKRE